MFSKRIVTISRLLIVYRLGQNSYLPLYVSMPLNDRYGEKIKYCLFFLCMVLMNLMSVMMMARVIETMCVLIVISMI